MNPSDYSLADLKLYYDGSYVHNRIKNTMVEIRDFHQQIDGDIHALSAAGHSYSLKDLNDDPKIGVLANGKSGAYYLAKSPERQYRKGVNTNNTKIKYIAAWGKWHVMDLLGRVTFKTQLKPFYNEINYPPIGVAAGMLDRKLSAAFAPKFAVAIPPVGGDPAVMRMNHMIGYFKDDVVFLNKRLSHYKEELEQYVQVNV